jgi:serine/threonine-protein kinase
MPGATLGGYDLIERLAVGGMAEVFLAQRGEERVAVKRILPHLVEKPDFVAMFLEEARIAKSLAHPHLIAMRDFGHDGDSWFLAMEYVAGEDLSALVKRARRMDAPIPPADVAAILIAAADALAHAHAAGIVHRDVTPSNLMVSYDGVVKLADFGIASTQAQAGEPVKGKRKYMAPEQAAGGPIDRRADVYSLGLCGWELLSGKRDAKLTAIVLKAMHRDPERRWQSAHEFRDALRSWLAASCLVPSLATTMRWLFGADARERERRAEVPTEPTAVSRPRPRVRWPFRWAAVAAAGIAVGLALRTPPPPAPEPPPVAHFRPARALPPPPARRPHSAARSRRPEKR